MFVGRDSSGGAFCYDPWVLYGEGALDDPNVIVLGKLGQGKSALVKTLLWRMLLFGRRAFVLDVKREYGPLCRGGGGQADLARPRRRRAPEPAGLAARGARPAGAAPCRDRHCARRSPHPGRSRRAARGAAGGTSARRGADAARVAASCSRRSPRWPTAADHAEQLAADARRAALALQDLCEGPLRGMFDGPTTPGLDLDARCSCSTCTPSATRPPSGS